MMVVTLCAAFPRAVRSIALTAGRAQAGPRTYRAGTGALLPRIWPVLRPIASPSVAGCHFGAASVNIDDAEEIGAVRNQPGLGRLNRRGERVLGRGQAKLPGSTEIVDRISHRIV